MVGANIESKVIWSVNVYFIYFYIVNTIIKVKRFLVLLVLILFPFSGISQEVKSANLSADDTLKIVEFDTTGFYGDLYHYSKDHKWLFMAYKAIFNVSAYLGGQDLDIADDDSIYYKKLKGKPIGTIKIVNYAPFGNSVSDTAGHKKSTIEKIGNSLHFKTHESVIRNLLLFEEGDILDLYRVSESERLIRRSKYIRDAKIRLVENNGVVDVIVYSLDLWSWKLGVSISDTKVGLKFTGYNMFGLGHEFSNKTVIRYKNVDNNALQNTGYYRDPNIGSTFINGELRYKFSNNEEYKGISFQRDFYSPLTKYAGGIEFVNTILSDSIRLTNESYDEYNYDANYSSIWAARSFQIRKGKTIEERATRLVVSVGYSQVRYNSVETISDSVYAYFRPFDLYLTEFGFSNRKYYTDRYVLKFGEKEDIPTGRILKFTSGYRVFDKTGNYYVGVTTGGAGILRNLSYISFTSSYGSYIDSGVFNDGIFKSNLFYYSHLYGKYKWKMRWFAEADFTTGINRRFNEFIKLSEGDWVPGYNKIDPQGNSRFAFNITTVIFSPFEWVGFRFTPVVFGGMGVLGKDVASLFKSKIYPGFGGGFTINNIYLVQSEFRLFIGYYYQAPGDDFRMSSFDVWEYELRDFGFEKPAVIVFE